jgi:hypothetical protein
MDLPYPTGEVTADEVADNVYFVNHFYALDNFSIQEKGNKITIILNKSAGSRPLTLTVERFLNNDYDDDPDIKAKDLAIFRSGKLRGTGMLITDFVDDSKSQLYEVWLPALRKIRRFAQPAHDDAWGGTDFTFGDVTLRKPLHETHELQGKETFDGCLGFIDLEPSDRRGSISDVPTEGSCVPKGREVYVLKSTTKFSNWWYDYRVSYVDTETFADYRTDYFKDGEKIKVIDRDWASFDMDDPRAQYWKYWYGITLDTGHETWAVIPEEVVVANDPTLEPTLWTQRTLRKIKR